MSNDLIMACLEKKPSDRPQSMTAILQILYNIQTSVSHVSRPVAGLSSAIETKCWELTWPQDKPIQEIVFPQLLNTEKQTVATICMMLAAQEIHQRVGCQLRNEFIWLKSPHPMLLWVTIMYSPTLGYKWLPCYLDLQKPQNQQLVSALATHERYPVIGFTLESPHTCASVLSSYITHSQRQMLKTWLAESKSLPPANQARVSKELLKQQYKQMQARLQQ